MSTNHFRHLQDDAFIQVRLVDNQNANEAIHEWSCSYFKDIGKKLHQPVVVVVFNIREDEHTRHIKTRMRHILILWTSYLQFSKYRGV